MMCYLLYNNSHVQIVPQHHSRKLVLFSQSNAKIMVRTRVYILIIHVIYSILKRKAATAKITLAACRDLCSIGPGPQSISS